MTIIFICPQCNKPNKDPTNLVCPRCGYRFERRENKVVKHEKDIGNRIRE